MTRGQLAPTIGLMPAKSGPCSHQRLRLVLDHHERDRSELAHELHEHVAQALEPGGGAAPEEALASVAGQRGLAVWLDSAVPGVRISVRPLDVDTAIGELGTLEARLELLGGTLTASSGELVMHIPIERATDGVSAAFPRPPSVEIPDGDRRALP
jgi:hypothetical protein